MEIRDKKGLTMKSKDLRDLLSRAAAVIEDPSSENGRDKANLVADLIAAQNVIDTPSVPAETMEEKTIDLAQRIYRDAEGLAGSEVAEGMFRALNATDDATIEKIEIEFFSDAD